MLWDCGIMHFIFRCRQANIGSTVLSPVSTFLRDYLRKFSKKVETILMSYSGARGTLIHEKNWSRKSRVRLPISILTAFTITVVPGVPLFATTPAVVSVSGDVACFSEFLVFYFAGVSSVAIINAIAGTPSAVTCPLCSCCLSWLIMIIQLSILLLPLVVHESQLLPLLLPLLASLLLLVSLSGHRLTINWFRKTILLSILDYRLLEQGNKLLISMPSYVNLFQYMLRVLYA